MGYEDPGAWKQRKIDRKQGKVEKLSKKISKVEAGTKNPARLQQLKTRLQTAKGDDPTKTSESVGKGIVDYRDLIDPAFTGHIESFGAATAPAGPAPGLAEAGGGSTDVDPTTTTSSAVPSFRSGGPTTGTGVDPTASRSDYVSMKKTAEKAFDPNKGLPIGTGIPSGTGTETGTGEVVPIDPSAPQEVKESVSLQKKVAGYNVEAGEKLFGTGPTTDPEAEKKVSAHISHFKDPGQYVRKTDPFELAVEKSRSEAAAVIAKERAAPSWGDDPSHKAPEKTRKEIRQREKLIKETEKTKKPTFRERRKIKQEEKLEEGLQKAIKQRESYEGSTGSSNDPFIYKPN